MLVLRVEYATGVCMATRHDDPARATPEWPPHPDRLYSALVAAAAEPEPTGETGLPVTAKQALEWLAEQGSPLIHASCARPRTTPLVAMPSNPHENEIWLNTAKSNPRSFNVLPVYRKKALLPMPAVIPDDPRVYFVWPSAKPGRHQETLRSICDHVTCLGRSRSLVRVTVEDRAPAATHIPDPTGDIQLRVPLEGRLTYLSDKHARDGGRPAPSPSRRYRQVDGSPGRSAGHSSVFNRFWVFHPTPGDPALPIEQTVNVTRALRASVLKQLHGVTCGCARWNKRVPSCQDAGDCYAQIPSALSGYAPDCGPLQAPHLAFIPLPFVHPVQRHADGSIKGLAILIPRNLDGDTSALEVLAKALVRIEEDGLRIPRIGTWRLREVPTDDPPLLTLDRNTWVGPSRRWTTATPMVFGHFPKSKNGGEAKVVLDSLRIAGIDASNVIEIATDKHASLHGAPPSWHFETQREPARTTEPRRWIRHVTLQFDRPVSGPLTIGTLRYFGLGLMRPLESNNA